MNFKKNGRTSGGNLHDRLDAWVELLTRCGSKPTRKQVHALRVSTLRLQAELERDLADLPHASHQAQAMLRFGKQAEKLRQALGPTREIDVWMSKLHGLRASISQPGEYVPRSLQECLRGIDRFEERLKKNRRTAAKALVVSIEKKRGRFVKAAKNLEATTEETRLPDSSGIGKELVAHFSRVRAEYPVLNEANLHEFRKRIKTVRYLAETHEGADRECARIATQMRKLQSAIGEWHDWQALAEEVRSVHHDWSAPLAELLDSVSKETFQAALETAQAVTARMIGEDKKPAETLSAAEPRRPVRIEIGPHMADEQKLA